MPTSPLQLCVVAGCPNLVPYGRCPEHRSEQRRDSDARRPSAAARGYGHGWQSIRDDYLASHPQCESDKCRQLPHWQRPAATDVDHLDGLGPRGDNSWSNLQALCHPCHSRKTALHDGGFGRRPRT